MYIFYRFNDFILFLLFILSVLTFPKTNEYFINRTMDLGGFSISQYSFWFGFLLFFGCPHVSVILLSLVTFLFLPLFASSKGYVFFNFSLSEVVPSRIATSGSVYFLSFLFNTLIDGTLTLCLLKHTHLLALRVRSSPSVVNAS